jgi:hypothetical protein
MTDSSARQQHLFIVRLWHEPSQIAAPGQWRGSVEHAESGQRRYFIALGDLAEFVASRLGEAQLDGAPAADPI